MACYAQGIVKLERPIWDSERSRQIWQIPVDCGKCYECLRRRKQQWAFRLEQEGKVSNTVRFVTLTYDTKELPFTKWGNPTLDKKDVVRFMKRLRYYHETEEVTWYEREQIKRKMPIGKRRKIKYYAVGEYGELKGRPHYHLIIFNALDDHIKKAWPKGQVWIDSGNVNTFIYVLSYLEKSERKQEYDKERQKKFSLQSTKLGFGYIDKAKKWHNEDNDRNYVTLEKVKIAIPKTLRKKIYDEDKRREMVPHIKYKVELAEAEEHNRHLRNKHHPELMRISKINAKEAKKSTLKIRDFR